MLKLGVDVGGTFTDLCLLQDDAGEVWVEKLESTPGDQSLAFVSGVQKVLEGAGLDPDEIDFLVHGTTVATNALLEHKGARTALVTTKGFRDVLEIGTSSAPPSTIFSKRNLTPWFRGTCAWTSRNGSLTTEAS